MRTPRNIKATDDEGTEYTVIESVVPKLDGTAWASPRGGIIHEGATHYELQATGEQLVLKSGELVGVKSGIKLRII